MANCSVDNFVCGGDGKTDAQLSANPDKYVLLQDDKHIFPAGNVIWVTDQSTVQKAGPDYMATIVKVQKGLTLPVIQELNARVDVDKHVVAVNHDHYFNFRLDLDVDGPVNSFVTDRLVTKMLPPDSPRRSI